MRHAALVPLCVLVCVLISHAAEAAPISRFGGRGSEAGEFVEAHGVAVGRKHADVYVLDSNNHRIERYARDGRFLLAWGWGVADGHSSAVQICRRRCYAGLGGSGTGQLSFAEGIAVDNNPHSRSYGDVYVVDIGSHRVQKFSPDGRFLVMFGGAVNRTAHGQHRVGSENRCPVMPGDRCGAGVVAARPGSFEFDVEGNFIAVGGGGRVYVADRNRIEIFNPDGSYHSEVRLPAVLGEGKELGGVSGLSLDNHGDMYVIQNGVSGIRKYDPSGRLLLAVDDKGWPAKPEEPAPAIESDSSGGIFVDAYEHGQHRVLHYDQTGRLVASFDSGMPDALHGLAYNPVTNQLYLINTNSESTPQTAWIRIITPPPDTHPIVPVFPFLATLGWLTQW